MSTTSADVVAGTNATAKNYNDLRADHVLGKNLVNTETDGTTITVDVSDATKGRVRTVTIAATGRTVTFSNAVAGQLWILEVVQDAGGSKTITTWTNVTWSNGVAPTLSTGANKIDYLGFYAKSPTDIKGFVIGQTF